MQQSLENGGLWLDDQGIHINAHGGGVLHDGDRYYWFGEHKVEGPRGNAAWVGVGCYSSTDLVNWRNEGVALAVTKEPSDLQEGNVIERPKVVRCPKTGQYVMYFHLEFQGQFYYAARVGIAVSDTPVGPYRYLRSLRPDPGTWPDNGAPGDRTPEALERSLRDVAAVHSCGPSDEGRAGLLYPADVEGGQQSRDMTLFVDDDGKAYHSYSSEFNSTLHISELTDDYLDYSGRWWRVAEKDWTEGAALCRRGDWYYLLGSGCTGWDPNAAHFYRAKALSGPWERLDNPCRGVNEANGCGADLTFGGQSTFILRVDAPAAEPAFVAMFDLWRPQNAIDGRYAWLPIDFSGETPVIEWKKAWKKLQGPAPANS